MGCYCRICGGVCPNEEFSGNGHRSHVCKECRLLPREEREKIEIGAELSGFLTQSRISKKNVKRLQELAGHADSAVARRAELLIRVAKIAEGKRKRWRKVCQADKALLIACGEAGLLEEWIPEEIYRANRGPLEDDDGLEERIGDYPTGRLEMGAFLLLQENVSSSRSQEERARHRRAQPGDLLEEEEIPW